MAHPRRTECARALAGLLPADLAARLAAHCAAFGEDEASVVIDAIALALDEAEVDPGLERERLGLIDEQPEPERAFTAQPAKNIRAFTPVFAGCAVNALMFCAGDDATAAQVLP